MKKVTIDKSKFYERKSGEELTATEKKMLLDGKMKFNHFAMDKIYYIILE
jgi:hypothetical protein